RLGAGQVDDVGPHQRAHKGLEAAAHDAAEAVVLGGRTVDAGGPPDRLDRDGARELDLDVVRTDPVQVLQAGDLHQVATADDPDPVADVLHLGEHVRGEEDRGTVLLHLPDHV